MLKNITQFFDTHLRPGAGDEGAEGDEHALRMATAALLIEITRADRQVSSRESEAVTDSIKRIFTDLSDEETRELIQLAEQEADEATSLFQFTNLVDKHFSREQKIHIVEMLWRVVFSDEHKDKHEEYLVRQLADLLHVSHRDFVRTRHLVESEQGKSS